MKNSINIILICTTLFLVFCDKKQEPIIKIEGLSRDANLYIEEKINQLKGLANESIIIQAIETSNERNKDLTMAEIDSLDWEWIQNNSEDNSLIKELISNTCADHLKKFQAQHPEILEIFVMDNRGLIVGESNITSDYLQADEPKWSEVFGKAMIWYGGLEFDESTKTYGIQISVPVQNIGAVCATINLKNIKGVG